MRFSGAFLLFIITATLTGQVIHVDGILGSDSNPGTELLPVRTVAMANSLLQPGATLKLRAGQEFLLNANGAQPLFIQHSQVVVDRYGRGANPILDGEDVVPAIGLLGASYVTIQNITLRNGTLSSCMLLGGAVNGLLMANCRFQGGSIGLEAQAAQLPSGYGNQLVACNFLAQNVDGLSIHGDIHFTIVQCIFAMIGLNNPFGGAGDACSSHDTATIGAYSCLFLENRRGAMVNINNSGTNYLVNCSVKSTVAPSLVRQDGGGTTVVVNCRLTLAGAQLGAAVLTFAGGTIQCAFTRVTNASSNPNSVSFFSSANLSAYNCTRDASGGALHAGITGSGTFMGDFNSYLQTGTLWVGPSGPIDFPTWQALTGADLNSLGASG